MNAYLNEFFIKESVLSGSVFFAQLDTEEWLCNIIFHCIFFNVFTKYFKSGHKVYTV